MTDQELCECLRSDPSHTGAAADRIEALGAQVARYQAEIEAAQEAMIVAGMREHKHTAASAIEALVAEVKRLRAELAACRGELDIMRLTDAETTIAGLTRRAEHAEADLKAEVEAHAKTRTERDDARHNEKYWEQLHDDQFVALVAEREAHAQTKVKLDIEAKSALLCNDAEAILREFQAWATAEMNRRAKAERFTAELAKSRRQREGQ
jgi:peroxiredoxin family protein